MTLPTISPADARQLLDKGASLLDIREADEQAREKILGAHNLPLSKLDESDLALQQGKPVIFHLRQRCTHPRACAAARCESGDLRSLRARRRAQRLEARRAPRRDRSAIMAAHELRLKETLDGPRLFRPCARKPFLQRPAFQAFGARQPDERSCLWDDRRSGHRQLSRRISGAAVFVLLGRLQSQIRS